MKKTLLILLSVVTVLFLGACSNNSSSDVTSKSTLIKVLLTDDPASYKAVYVTIEKVAIHLRENDDDTDDNSTTEDSNTTEEGDNGWITIAEPNKTYDLLTLQNGVTEELGEANISVGSYTQMRLILGDEPDDADNILGEQHPHTNYVVFTGDDVAELKVPSNTLKYNHTIDAEADSAMTMTIDFDANASIHQSGKSGQWILTPVISVQTKKDN